MKNFLCMCWMVVVGTIMQTSWGSLAPVYPSCVFTDSRTGLFYDLSPLQNCGSDYVVGGFFVNICQGITHGGCGPATGVCQSQAGAGCGEVPNAVLSSTPVGVILTYPNGDLCFGYLPRTAIFQLVCNASQDVPLFTYLVEDPTCTYNFKIVSKSVCPKAVAPPAVVCPGSKYNNTEIVDIFVIPHSHDDVGWLDTPQGYYNSRVKNIIDGYVTQLSQNSNRSFIQVEQAFFSMWWNDPRTTSSQKNQLRQLLVNKQLEFVLGGWCMSDEATPTYSAMIDQLTQGHQFLLDNFGSLAIPAIGWQIDPFGASSFTPTLFSLAGFKALVLDRIAYQEKFSLQDKNMMQMLWQSSLSLGKTTEIFTHLLDTNYCSPMLNGFSFEGAPNAVTEDNVASYADKFVSISRMKRLWSGTSNVLVPWGCDFAFNDAASQFKNMDKIIAYVQQHKSFYNVTIKYATLTQYFSAVLASKANWQVRAGENSDFFPYNDDDNSWWTGYFTSRPMLKKQVRQSEALSRSADSLFGLTSRAHTPAQYYASFDNLNTLRMALGEAQHHDAVSGTEKQLVADQYSADLTYGSNLAIVETANSIAGLVGNSTDRPNLEFYNGTVLHIADNEIQVLVVYNSLGWSRNEFTRVYVNRNDLAVFTYDSKVVPHQITTDYLNPTNTGYLLYFQATTPPLGLRTYFVSTRAFFDAQYPGAIRSMPRPAPYSCSPPNLIGISNFYLKVAISDKTHRISSITNCVNSTVTYPVDQNFWEYKSYTPTGSQNSGAYIFRTDGPAVPLSSTNPAFNFTDGDWVHEIRQSFLSTETNTIFATQIIRLFSSSNEDPLIENMVEIEHKVGPLPGLDAGREFITRFTTGLKTQGQFYHDDNGFEILHRTYNPSAPNPIPANYYPGVYSAFIKDASAQLSVVMDSSHGISSQSNGALEIMLNRRLLRDDQRGVGEPLFEPSIATPVLRVIMDTPDNALYASYKQNYLLNFPVTIATTKINTLSSWVGRYSSIYSPLEADLPATIHLLSFKMLSKKSSTTVLLRLTHLYEKGQSDKYVAPVNIDVSKMFSGFTVKSCTETTVTANQVLSVVKDCKLVISAKQIRTLLIDLI